jgi:quinoprotein glucose dehydrogenase
VIERIAVRCACALAALLGTALTVHAQSAAQHSVWDGVYTAAQADRGKAVYESHCSKCHGDDLGGKDEVPELSGAHFMADWQSQSLADLVQRIRSTMPLDNPGTLGGASTTDVVAFLLQQNGAPVGSAELPNDASMQSIIRIDAEPAPAPKPGANAPRRASDPRLYGLLGIWRWTVACVSGAPDLNL